MQFLDRTLLRLTDPAERLGVLTPAVGDRLLRAAYVFNSVEVGEVTGVSVRDVDILPAVHQPQRVDGAFMDQASGMRWEGTGTIGASPPLATAHARIEVLLTTETRVVDTSIQAVESDALHDLAEVDLVDARIVADDGALPGDPGALATRRFSALKTMVHERFAQPAEFDADGLFDTTGVDTFDELLAYLSPSGYAQHLRLDLVVDGTLPSHIVNHRVIAAVHIDEDPVARLKAVVQEIQTGRALMEAGTETAVPPRGMAARTGLPYMLIFAGDALDDDDLPVPVGSNPGTPAARRSARLTELQTRLQPFGIALATISN